MGSDLGLRTPLFLLMVVVFLCAVVGESEGRDSNQPGASDYSLKPIEAVDHVVTERLDVEAVRRADERRRRRGGPYRFAVPRKVLITSWTDGTWEDINDEVRLWRLRVTAPGAMSINLEFGRYYMPPGGSMLIYSTDDTCRLGLFTDADNKKHGRLWTPVIHADDIILEVRIPASQVLRLELELISINHGYRSFMGVFKGDKDSGDSGTCNVNVVCPEGDDWHDQIRSVAVYSFGGIYQCTGVLANNTAEDETPYFLTAWHCFDPDDNGVIDNPEESAASMIIYWNYQAWGCWDEYYSDGQAQFGAVFRAAYKPSDFALVELDDKPSMAFNVYYSGWDRSDTAPASAVAIHHPSGDVKKISIEDDPLSVTSYLGEYSPGDGTHLRVADWDIGTTEPGSSGSPVFNNNKYLAGLLHGGRAACDNDEPDWYGRFQRSWTGGGTPSTRLSDWLDPNNISGMSLEGRNPGMNLDDLKFFGLQWLRNSCNDFAGDETDWCFGTDFTRDHRVDLEDFVEFAARWLE